MPRDLRGGAPVRLHPRRRIVHLVGPFLLFVLTTAKGFAATAQQHVDSPQSVQGEELPTDGPTADSLATLAEQALRDVMYALRLTVDSPPQEDLVLRTLGTLDNLSGPLSDDNWIAGHRVGLRVMTGDLTNALRVAYECGAEGWWCSMLSGYVLHLLEHFSAAEAAFDAGLAAMTLEHRCHWMDDFGLLLDGELSRLYENADCATRIGLERRIWWLSDPLYLLPANDRKTEHLARAVAMHLHHEGLAMSRGECVITHAAEIQMGLGRIAYLYDASAEPTGYSFVPSGSPGSRPLEASTSEWNLYSAAALERYSPPYGPIEELDRQVAMFIRGDSVAVVAGAEIGGRPLAGGRMVDQGLILSRSDADPPIITRGERDGDRFVFRATVPAEPHVMGIELLTEDEGVARARFGYAPPTRTVGGLGLSDLLLFDWDASVGDRLDSVAPRAVGTHRIRRTRDIGIFWEIYGLEAGKEVDLSLVMTRDARTGILERLATALRLRSATPPIAVAWKEEVGSDAGDIMGRSLRVGIGHLPAGQYTLEIKARSAGGGTTTTSRVIELVDR